MYFGAFKNFEHSKRNLKLIIQVFLISFIIYIHRYILGKERKESFKKLQGGFQRMIEN